MSNFTIKLLLVAWIPVLMSSCHERYHDTPARMKEKNASSSKEDIYIPNSTKPASQDHLGIYRGVQIRGGDRIKTIINLKENAEVTITEQLNGNFLKKVGNYRFYHDTLDITLKKNDTLLRFILNGNSMQRIEVEGTSLSSDEKTVFSQVDPNDFERI